MAMNTVFLHLSEEAIKRLNKLRGWRKVSRSAILREAVEQYLERQQFPVRKLICKAGLLYRVDY